MYAHPARFIQMFMYSSVLRPIITNVTFTPHPTGSSLLLNFTNSQLMSCNASGGPRIMTMWLYYHQRTLRSALTVLSGDSSVIHNISSSSTSDAGIYFCKATIDGESVTSNNYTLIGKSCYYIIT